MLPLRCNRSLGGNDLGKQAFTRSFAGVADHVLPRGVVACLTDDVGCPVDRVAAIEHLPERYVACVPPA